MAEPPDPKSADPKSPEPDVPEQIANRRAARERVAALGRPLYPNRWAPPHLVSDVVARWSAKDAAALEAPLHVQDPRLSDSRLPRPSQIRRGFYRMAWRRFQTRHC